MIKHYVTNLMICGGAIFLCPAPTRAEPYTLSYRSSYANQKHLSGSKAPRRPLVIDLTDNTFTFPTQVVGYTLTLKGEAGSTYTYYIIDTTFTLPQRLSGEYSITVSDGNSMYQGIINIE